MAKIIIEGLTKEQAEALVTSNFFAASVVEDELNAQMDELFIVDLKDEFNYDKKTETYTLEYTVSEDRVEEDEDE